VRKVRMWRIVHAGSLSAGQACYLGCQPASSASLRSPSSAHSEVLLLPLQLRLTLGLVSLNDNLSPVCLAVTLYAAHQWAVSGREGEREEAKRRGACMTASA
jgi:hypothetical protein